MPNSAARKNLQEAIEAEKAQAARRLRHYEDIVQRHHASQQPGGMPLSVADLLEWHSFEQQRLDEVKLAKGQAAPDQQPSD